MSSDDKDAADGHDGVDGSAEQNADTTDGGSDESDTDNPGADNSRPGTPDADDPQVDDPRVEDPEADPVIEPTSVSGDETALSDGGRDTGLAAFIAASMAASRAEAERDESSSLWGDTAAEADEPSYVEVRRSAPGWAISKWVISAAIAAAVIILSFIMIPRLFTPSETDPAAGTTTAPPTTAAPTTTVAPVISYPEVVMASGPTHYWRFEMQSAGADSAGAANLEVGSGAAILGSSAYVGGMGSIDCSGTSKSRALSTLAETPTGDFSIEAWINTVTSDGGPIVTFGNRKTDPSTKLDRVMYMATNGEVYFGTQAKSREFVVSELPVNNGTWRHLVGTMSTTNGLTLYVDGQPVDTEKDGTSTSDFEGYWKICGDNTSGWVGNSGRPAFTGTVDDVAVYPKALTAQEVLDHYQTARGL